MLTDNQSELHIVFIKAKLDVKESEPKESLQLSRLRVLSSLTQMCCCVCVQESEDAVKTLAKDKDMLEREKWDLRRQTKEATEQANILRSQMDMKENRIKELEAELTMVSPPHTDTSCLANLPRA